MGLAWWRIVAVLFLLVAIPSAAPAQTRKDLLLEPARVRCDQILSAVELGQTIPAEATVEARALMHWLIAYADPEKEAGAFREAAIAIGALDLLANAEASALKPLTTLLRQAPDLAARLAFSIDRRPEAMPKTADVLNQLRVASGSSASRLNEYAALASAICVVHDEPATGATVAPNEIFEFFTRKGAPARFDVREVPASLLVNVVDAKSPLSELEWARRQYAGCSRLLDVYMLIRRRAGEAPTILPPEAGALGDLIHRVQTGNQGNEIIVDRALAEIGKALAIPTVVVNLWDSEQFTVVAAIGAQGKIIEWNYSVGGQPWPGSLRGTAEWPVFRQRIDFSYIQILGWAFNYPVVEREKAMALAMGATMLAALEKEPGGYPPPPDALASSLGGGRVTRFRPPNRPPRAATASQALALADAAARTCPAIPSVWEPVRVLARDGRMTLEEKRQWADLIARLCGREQPVFSWNLLVPMVMTVNNPGEQSRLWDRMAEAYGTQGDLAARARFAQGELWEKQGDTDRALRSYAQVAERNPLWSDGVVASLEKMASALGAAGRGSEIIPLYIGVWERVKQPARSWPTPAWEASTWCMVGEELADRLEQAGRADEARKVRAAITPP